MHLAIPTSRNRQRALRHARAPSSLPSGSPSPARPYVHRPRRLRLPGTRPQAPATSTTPSPVPTAVPCTRARHRSVTDPVSQTSPPRRILDLAIPGGRQGVPVFPPPCFWVLRHSQHAWKSYFVIKIQYRREQPARAALAMRINRLFLSHILILPASCRAGGRRWFDDIRDGHGPSQFGAPSALDPSSR